MSPILSSAQGVQKRSRAIQRMFRTVHADCPIPYLATFIHVKTVRRNKSLKKATLYISSMSVECFTAPQFQAHMSWNCSRCTTYFLLIFSYFLRIVRYHPHEVGDMDIIVGPVTAVACHDKVTKSAIYDSSNQGEW